MWLSIPQIKSYVILKYLNQPEGKMDKCSIFHTVLRHSSRHILQYIKASSEAVMLSDNPHKYSIILSNTALPLIITLISVY